MTSVSAEVTEADVMAAVSAYQEGSDLPPLVFVHAKNRIVSVPRGNVAMIEYLRNPQ